MSRKYLMGRISGTSGHGKLLCDAVNNDPKNVPSHEAIAARSKEIWSAEGNPEGLDLDHWLRAETELCENFKPERDAEEP